MITDSLVNEWESTAEYLAERGYTGKYGESFHIPKLTLRCFRLIESDPEAFADRVQEYAYGIAMERLGHLGDA